jgi:small subunit ribosomal protein S18
MTKKLKLKIISRLVKKKMRKTNAVAKKTCRFCSDVEYKQGLDYKNGTFLRSFLTERGKILPSRIAGHCAKHQRVLSGCIKKSRMMALIPYSAQTY